MRRVIIAALWVGAVAGGVAAVAIPGETAPAPAPLRFAPERASARFAPPRLRAQPGSVKVEARRRDPGGGPDWALRTMVDMRRNQLCVQLGRIARGRFGWVDGTNTYRPVSPRYDGAPISCDRKTPGPGGAPRLSVATLIADIDHPTAHLTRTVVWGLGGMSARRVALRTGKRTTEPRLSPQGGFIEFRPPTVGREDAQATFHYPGGRSQTIYGDGNEREIMASVPHLRPVRGQSQIDARAPDPHGGLPYAVGVVRSRYGWCTMLDTRIVGDAVGRIDFDLGTFATAGVGASACSEPGRGPTRRRPVFAAYTIGGSVPGQGADPERGRVARRTLSGVTTVGGTTAPDVTAITIATPRDVRTLTPSPRAHAFLAVYDGEFPTGEIVITARFSDGTSRVADRFDLGGL